MKHFAFGLSVLLVFAPLAASAVTYDAVVTASDITLVPEHPLVGQQVHIYVTVHNAGTLDTEGLVVFNDGDALVGRRAYSLKEGGAPDDLWTTWVPTTPGNHTLTVSAVNDPGYPEASPENNKTTLTVFVDQDANGNGIPDSTEPPPPPPAPTSTKPTQTQTTQTTPPTKQTSTPKTTTTPKPPVTKPTPPTEQTVLAAMEATPTVALAADVTNGTDAGASSTAEGTLSLEHEVTLANEQTPSNAQQTDGTPVFWWVAAGLLGLLTVGMFILWLLQQRESEDHE